MRLALLVSVVVVLLSGCVIEVGTASPRPNVDVDQLSQTLSFVIDDSIKDAYEVPAQAAIAAVSVTGWRKTLRAGYDAGLSSASGAGPDNLEVRLVRADLTFSSAAVTAEGTAVAARAHVTYQARLVDSTGKVLRKSSGTAIAKTAVTSKYEATANASAAVESMFELIAADFFGTPLPTGESAPVDAGTDPAAPTSAPPAAGSSAPPG
jgi:hypothetical protein